MKKIKCYVTILFLFVYGASIAQTTNVNHFQKVIISPHIRATLIEGNKESVTIDNSTVTKDKIKIEVDNQTLQVYLEGAKEITKDTTITENGRKKQMPLYTGTVVTATITYKTLNNLSVRGEDTSVCKSLLKGDNFRLKIYGQSHVFLNAVKLGELQSVIYGESTLDIASGSIRDQRFVVYGDSKVNGLGISNKVTKITAYGDADFRVNVSGELRIASFGDAKIAYKGDPVINKGLNIGDEQIEKIE